VFELKPESFLCAYPPTRAALFRGRTRDYNLVRAVCIWLGSSNSPEVERELIELVGHPSPTVAYNARFALAHSQDPRVRELIERYEPPTGPAVPRARCAGQPARSWREPAKGLSLGGAAAVNGRAKKSGGSRWAPGGNAAAGQAARSFWIPYSSTFFPATLMLTQEIGKASGIL
jgi:hypothetical protein